MNRHRATHSTAPADVAVLLGDPRLPYAYNKSGRIEPHDLDDVHALKDALAALQGYRFTYLDDHERLLGDLSRQSPSLVLNFCNTGYRNHMWRQLHIPALLEMVDLPYAGAGPEALVVCHDKDLVRLVAGELGIPVPRQTMVDLTAAASAEPPAFPVIVKPNHGDGSFGITENALARSQTEVDRQLRWLADVLERPTVVLQEFLPGAEYSVLLVGNPGAGFVPLPPLEIDFGAIGPGLPPIMTHASKVDPDSPYWSGLRFRPARLPGPAREGLLDHCRRLFARLGCRDYTRFDFRADAGGEPRLIDVNAHPTWGRSGMVHAMAEYAGYSDSQLLGLIVEAAHRRLASGPKGASRE
ncbi:MAG: ATP-grasp domain-containing protein [Gammaproteobacteria bacterium]|nr:ATP-grasp domain-containing protein [Gammaproteobacteria bacterium]NIR31094.1 ATP-grasp domain-containing protein [Gammaproteobacteria bacterium]NIR98549.1 ATP-grasp domain-containing protein [Gammaproteobacteria bacterium]NIT64271.1 ATP-grasp domain-containing protein [Gammaproteobacteria bacterium]NIV21876.1 ATP-grasp domain-containing protein [Gammaproteobacteria bacterium]